MVGWQGLSAQLELSLGQLRSLAPSLHPRTEARPPGGWDAEAGLRGFPWVIPSQGNRHQAQSPIAGAHLVSRGAQTAAAGIPLGKEVAAGYPPGGAGGLGFPGNDWKALPLSLVR